MPLASVLILAAFGSVILVLGTLAALLPAREMPELRHRILALTILVLAVLPALLLVPPGAEHRHYLFLGPRTASAWLDWAPRLTALWFAGALAALLSLTARLLAVSRQKWRPIDDARIADAWRLLQGPATVRLVYRPGSPSVWGLFRPVVSLPDEARHWPDQLVRAALAHELGHIRRRDWAFQVAGSTVSCLYWFNPLVGRLAREMRGEAERLCDRSVVASGTPAVEYAESLVLLARRFGHRRTDGLAMVSRPALQPRVEAILRPRPSVPSRRTTAILLSLAVFAATFLALSRLHGWTLLFPSRIPVSGGTQGEAQPVPLLPSRAR